MRRSWALLIGGGLGALALLAPARSGQLPPDRPLAQHRRRRTGQQLGGRARRVERRPAAQPVRARRSACSCRSSLLIGIRIAARRRAGPLAALAGADPARADPRRRRRLAAGRRRGQRPAGRAGAAPPACRSPRLIDLGLGAIGEPGIAEPFRIVAVGLCGALGLALCWFGLGLRADERAWIAARRLPRRERGARRRWTRSCRSRRTGRRGLR